MENIKINFDSIMYLIENTTSKTWETTKVDTWGGDKRAKLFKALWGCNSKYVIINDTLFSLERRIGGGCGHGEYPNSIVIKKEKCITAR